MTNHEKEEGRVIAATPRSRVEYALFRLGLQGPLSVAEDGLEAFDVILSDRVALQLAVRRMLRAEDRKDKAWNQYIDRWRRADRVALARRAEVERLIANKEADRD